MLYCGHIIKCLICCFAISSKLQPNKLYTVEQAFSSGGEITAKSCTYEIGAGKVCTCVKIVLRFWIAARYMYSQLLLSRLWLSRITAYLEKKSGPCYNTEI